MAGFIARGVFRTLHQPLVQSFAAVVGKKEGEGPLGDCFDKIVEDAHFGMETWEKAESRFQLEAVRLAVSKCGLRKEDIGVICAGDLVNQCVSSTYGLRHLEIPYLGIYGACSTMAEGLLTAACFCENGIAERALAVTSSHYSTAERQFRFPLSYGGQRTPTSQWTCTASGAVLLSMTEGAVEVAGGCIGKITDLGVSDINNMGSAMAPAAAETIRRYLTATETSPADYDYIVTGDLGIVGSKLLNELLYNEGIDIFKKHRDCGVMIFDPERQDTHCGGSGCGCSASVLCGHFLPLMERGDAHDILFAATGALMNPVTLQQGETIPAISHLIHFRRRA
ncbi:MAG: stage V sporulation protein AD [Ruminococcus sp.]|nr:stage V sporulation protein AD [Ruminococcus sp.]